jgi:hypothetical protein
VTFTLSAEFRGWQRLVLSGPVQRSMDGEMRALDTAKAVIESDSPTAQS